jgi:hypothetical protein
VTTRSEALLTLRARFAHDLSATTITEPGQSLTLGVRFDDKDAVIGDVVLFFTASSTAPESWVTSSRPDQ